MTTQQTEKTVEGDNKIIAFTIEYKLVARIYFYKSLHQMYTMAPNQQTEQFTARVYLDFLFLSHSLSNRIASWNMAHKSTAHTHTPHIVCEA